MKKSTVKDPHGGQSEQERFGLSRYFLLTMALSFLGWAFETCLLRITTGKWHDRGFLSMPLCPIYGCSLIAAFFLLGTPDEPRGILQKIENMGGRYALYLLFAFLIPSAAELFVALFFDKVFQVWLWSYDDLPMNLDGYVGLPVSLAWAVLIIFFMKFVFSPLKRLFGKLPRGLSSVLAIILLLALIVDLGVSIKHIL